MTPTPTPSTSGPASSARALRTLLACVAAPLAAAVLMAGCGGATHATTASRAASTAAPPSREALGVAIAERLLPNAPAAYVTCYLGEIDALSPTAFDRLRAEMTRTALRRMPSDVEKLDIGCMKDPATLRLVRGDLAATVGADARRQGLGAAYGACVSRVIAALPLGRVRQLVAAGGRGQNATRLGDATRRACGAPH